MVDVSLLDPLLTVYALNTPAIMKSAFILLGVALAALKATGNPQSPPVKVSLRSSWPAPPLLAEILYVNKSCVCKYAHVLIIVFF